MLSNLSTDSDTKLPITVLLVSTRTEDHIALQAIFRGSRWELRAARTARDGIETIRHHAEIAVVICEHTLPDGDWRSLLAQMDKMALPPSLIVSSRLADERLWADVLGFGAFDLLQGAPFEPEEVLRVTESAWSDRTLTARHTTLPRIGPGPARRMAGGAPLLAACSQI